MSTFDYEFISLITNARGKKNGKKGVFSDFFLIAKAYPQKINKFFSMNIKFEVIYIMDEIYIYRLENGRNEDVKFVRITIRRKKVK